MLLHVYTCNYEQFEYYKNKGQVKYENSNPNLDLPRTRTMVNLSYLIRE